MAGTRYYFPPRAQSVALALLPGATLTFYRSATLTPQPVFADRERRIPLNALRADSAGRFPEIHLDPALTYRAILTNEGVTIWDLNPLSPFPGSDTNIPLDNGGAAMPLAVLTYWLSRTTVLAPIYADAGMATPLANPLIADANGVFPSVFYNSLIEYRHRLEEGSRRLIFDHDPILPVPAVAVFGTALSSSNANGTTFTKPAAWSFGASDFSAEAWYKATQSVDNGQFRIVRARSAAGAQSGWDFRVPNGVTPNKNLGLVLRPASTSFSFTSPSFVMADETWFHIAVTVNKATNTATYYVNGASIGTSNITTGAGSVGIVGAASLFESIAGSVDEIRVWSDLRTPAEILNNYLLPYQSLADTSNIVEAFQFNEGSGATTTGTVQGTVATIVTGGTFVPGPL